MEGKIKLKKSYFGCSPHISQSLGGSTSVKKEKTGHGKIGAKESSKEDEKRKIARSITS